MEVQGSGSKCKRLGLEGQHEGEREREGDSDGDNEKHKRSWKREIEEAQSLILMTGAAMIQLDTSTGMTFEERERGWAHGI